MNDIILSTQNGEPVVSSRQIAESFGKNHRDVLESIKNISAENSAVTQMFFPTTYTAGTGKQYPMYLMNRDGFSLLVMGFTGKAALEWKLKYIAAFNEMEKQLTQKRQNELEGISPQLRYLIDLEKEQKRQAKELEAVHERLDAACEAFTLKAGSDWEQACQRAINGIAAKRGGTHQDYEDVWNEIYDAVDSRGFDLKRRVSNAQARSASYGISKTNVQKITRLKIISLSGDKKLICAFVDAVKEKAASSGVRTNKLESIQQTSLFSHQNVTPAAK